MRQQVADGDRGLLAVRPLGVEPGQVGTARSSRPSLPLSIIASVAAATKGLVTEAKRKIVSSRVRFSASRSA